MLGIPKTPRRALHCQNKETTRFRVEDHEFATPYSPRRRVKTFPDAVTPLQQKIVPPSFMAHSLTAGADAELESFKTHPPVTSTPRFGAPSFFSAVKIQEARSAPPPEPINLIFREESSPDVTLGCSKIEPELVVLDSSSDATPPTIRPSSEPLAAKPESYAPFRTTSAEPQLSKLGDRHFAKARPVQPSTIPITPRCARPTKAWLARFKPEPQENEVNAITKKSTLTAKERKAVWERLVEGQLKRK